MPLTLSEVAGDPALLTHQLTIREQLFVLRPLEHRDIDALAAFLEGLSAQTRHFSIFPSYDHETAAALCDAINRHDKLRLVLESDNAIVGLFEFSMDVPEGDIARYSGYGVALEVEITCRYGPTLADAYQNRGLGGATFPLIADVARQFGKPVMMLWGGVLAENTRAVHHYEKCGFRRVGEFTDHEGLVCLDMMRER